MTERYTVRVSDPDTSEALEQAAEQLGSKSAAIRKAIRREYAEPDAPDDAAATPDAGYEVLVTHAPSGKWIEVTRARSLVADALNMPSDSVRPEVFEPLRREGRIGVVSRLDAAYIQLKEDES